MENKLTIGHAIPAQGPTQGVQISFHELQLLIKTIKSIEKRLENVEKLLLEIQESLAKADEIETVESPEKPVAKAT